MGIGDKMRGMASNVQDGVRTSSMSFFHIFLRVITGFFLGLTLGLIGQELLSYGSLVLFFIIILVTGVILRVFSAWSLAQILIFDLICVLVAMLLRMYILVAP